MTGDRLRDRRSASPVDWLLLSCIRVVFFWAFHAALLFGAGNILDDNSEVWKLLDPRVSHQEAFSQ